MNHKKVQRIMKKYHLKPQYTKRIKNKSYKRIEENVKPNLVNRNINTDSPNRIWTTDITYLILNNKRAYLSTILDLYDRKIVAYKISYRNDLNIVIDTLNEAINKRKDVKGLIILSDQGFQYTSFQYKKICLFIKCPLYGVHFRDTSLLFLFTIKCYKIIFTKKNSPYGE